MDKEQEERILAILDAYSVQEIRSKTYKVLIYGTEVSGRRLDDIVKAGFKVISVEPKLVQLNTGDGIECSIDTYVNLVSNS